MVTTLEDGERRLAELVERASQGEDVLITVGGKVRARLTQVEDGDRPSWIERLRAHAAEAAAREQPTLTIDKILEEDRAERF